MAEDGIKRVNVKIVPSSTKNGDMSSRERMVHIVNLLSAAGVPVRKDAIRKEKDEKSKDQSIVKKETDIEQEIPKCNHDLEEKETKPIKEVTSKEEEKKVHKAVDIESGIPKCNHEDLEYKEKEEKPEREKVQEERPTEVVKTEKSRKEKRRCDRKKCKEKRSKKDTKRDSIESKEDGRNSEIESSPQIVKEDADDAKREPSLSKCSDCSDNELNIAEKSSPAKCKEDENVVAVTTVEEPEPIDKKDTSPVKCDVNETIEVEQKLCDENEKKDKAETSPLKIQDGEEIKGGEEEDKILKEPSPQECVDAESNEEKESSLAKKKDIAETVEKEDHLENVEPDEKVPKVEPKPEIITKNENEICETKSVEEPENCENESNTEEIINKNEKEASPVKIKEVEKKVDVTPTLPQASDSPKMDDSSNGNKEEKEEKMIEPKVDNETRAESESLSESGEVKPTSNVDTAADESGVGIDVTSQETEEPKLENDAYPENCDKGEESVSNSEPQQCDEDKQIGLPSDEDGEEYKEALPECDEVMDNERKCFVHMLGVLIMGTDIVLDYVQIRNYWKSGSETRDLFAASLLVMAIVPSILAFYLALIFTNSKAIFLYRGIFADTDDDVLSGMFSIPGIARVLAGPTCTPCLGVAGLSASMVADIFMLVLLFMLFFPFMFVVVTLTPIAGFFIGWKDMETSDLKRFYLIRYLNGPFEALPQMIINSIFINRSSKVSGTSVASLVFSLLSIFQVIHQGLGLGKYTCCGETGPRVFGGSGTFFETISHEV